MISLRWLADYEPEKLLYIERFKRNTKVPELLFMTVWDYICEKMPKQGDELRADELFIAVKCCFGFDLVNTITDIAKTKAVDANWADEVTKELENEIDIAEIESKINNVLDKHRYYIAGEYVDNDLRG
mgnify:FL=1